MKFEKSVCNETTAKHLPCPQPPSMKNRFPLKHEKYANDAVLK